MGLNGILTTSNMRVYISICDPENSNSIIQKTFTLAVGQAFDCQTLWHDFDLLEVREDFRKTRNFKEACRFPVWLGGFGIAVTGQYHYSPGWAKYYTEKGFEVTRTKILYVVGT